MPSGRQCVHGGGLGAGAIGEPVARGAGEIDAAYRTVRRQNVAAHLLRRLNSGGGTRAERHPLNQLRVARPFQRVIE
ncbi:hypothetical protein [Streptomyces sp. NPDC052042]|uniref:hypothetical protein n=1 Tax=Streptomyces sp. NPDC052042 TaxID=3365683 RepID=UPI0037D3C050